MKRFMGVGSLLAVTLVLRSTAFAASGTEGAAFLDIPVGAGPAAMGAAYSALANDVYAPTLNPGGLGFVDSTQFAGQHLSYLESIHYEYLGFALPLPRSANCSGAECPGSALGASIQYLGSGDITGRDESGNLTGDFSSYYTAYNLAYGRAFNEKLSLGVTGKMIQAKLDDVSANAFAADLGSLYKVNKDLTLAMTLTNMGTKLKFLNEGDSLPLALHLGAAYRPAGRWMITTEGVYHKTGLASFHMGGEWRAIEMLALRAGYRTDTLKELSPLAGLSTGIGIHVWGQELAYAWLPYGDLGNTHYVSLVMKFGEADRAKRNLIQYQNIKKHRTATLDSSEEMSPDYMQLMELLNDNETNVVRQRSHSGGELQ